jgi:type IV pilus assembly protein PilQ
VMQSKGLDMRKNGNVLLIAPRDELATKEKLELEAKQQVSELEPLRTATFQLNYQKVEVLQKLLTDQKQTILSKRGSVVVDQRTNKMFVQDIAIRIEELSRLIAQVDIPVRQVLIEARIVEADDRFSRNLGAKLGYNDLSSTVYRTVSVTDPVTGTASGFNVPVYGAGQRILGGTYGTVSGNLRGTADLSSQAGSDVTGTGLNAQGLGRSTSLDNTNFVNLPAAGINGNNPASFAISLFGSSLTKFLNLELSALEADQRGKVISSPRVLTADQGKAIIEQGTELPFQTATSSGATAISFRKANLSLEVVPQITPEGSVILDVKVNRDSVGQLTPSGFAINTRRVATQVLVENGGTVVIGGVYEQTERNVTNKVPFLGDVPILGNLFKNNQRQNDRTELLVFLTPRIVTDNVATR